MDPSVLLAMVQGLRNPHALQGRKRQPFGGRWILENTGFSFRKLTRIRNSQPAMSIALLSFLKEATRIWRATMAPLPECELLWTSRPSATRLGSKGLKTLHFPSVRLIFILKVCWTANLSRPRRTLSATISRLRCQSIDENEARGLRDWPRCWRICIRHSRPS